MDPPPRILVPPGQLPPPGGGIGTQTVPQQRPNISYFLFLSLMFYLLNSNNSGSTSSSLFNPPLLKNSLSNSTTSPYSQARHRLLLREARYEGLSRWLGASNTSEGWLNSTYFPQTTSNTSTSIKVTPFLPQDPQEPDIVVSQILQGMMKREEVDWRSEESLVYPMNLTGFIKGSWAVRDYTWSQLGLNETWQVESRRRRIIREKEDEESSNSTTNDSSNSLQRRQTTSISLDNATLPSLNSTLLPSSNSTFETVSTIYNRTLLRGSFPFTHHPSRSPNKALFNLRSVQTSATGPILLPFPSSQDEQDDSKLLMIRPDTPENPWDEWEKKGPVSYLGGDLTLSVEEGENAGSLTNLDVEAAHLIEEGLIYGYATPSFVRSHLVETVSLPFFSNRSDPTSYPLSNLTAQAIGRSMLKEVSRRLKNDVDNLDQTILDRESELSSPPSDSDEMDPSIPQCIFRFYGSLSPLPPVYTRSIYSEFYSSLFRPTGSSLPLPPTQTISYVLSSTNCGLTLVGTGQFLPTPLLWTRTKDFALLIGVAQAVLVGGLVRHLERVAKRPGTVGNVASMAVGVGCVVDAYVFVLLLTAGVVTSSTRSSLPLFLPSFLALLSSLLFGMRYVSMIRAATPLLPTRTPPARPTPTPAPAPVTPSREDLAANAAERRARGEEVSAEEEEEAVTLVAVPPAVVSSGSASGWTIVPTSEKVILALMLSALIGSIGIIFRWGWIPLIIVIVYSYWIPQIILNVERGTARQSLSNEFVISTTFARLVLPVYFYGYSDNVLDVDVSPWIYVLILYSSLQAVVLVLQSRASLGARFFLSQRTLDVLDLPQVHTWDYHQPLSASKLLDIEVSLREEGKPDEIGPDCPICMDNVAIRATKEEIEANGSVVAGERVRQAYALTPCGHLVHTECLQEWMNVRAICPVCRAGLPSLS